MFLTAEDASSLTIACKLCWLKKMEGPQTRVLGYSGEKIMRFKKSPQ
jgi:hypothetical protein